MIFNMISIYLTKRGPVNRMSEPSRYEKAEKWNPKPLDRRSDCSHTQVSNCSIYRSISIDNAFATLVTSRWENEQNLSRPKCSYK